MLQVPSAESANYVMSDMMSELEEMRFQSIQALRCENCEQVQAALWCQTCEAAACQSCMDDMLSTMASFGSVGGLGAPLEAHCELQGSTAVVTWQPPASSALPVVAYVVQRAVGEAGRYAPTGRTNGARLEQCVDDLAGQSLRYRVRAEDKGGNVGAWVQSPAVQLPETFGIELRFQSPFDENGVLHHIGSAGGQREYKNAHNTGDVVASMSSIHSGQPSPRRAAHTRGARVELHVRPTLFLDGGGPSEQTTCA